MACLLSLAPCCLPDPHHLPHQCPCIWHLPLPAVPHLLPLSPLPPPNQPLGLEKGQSHVRGQTVVGGGRGWPVAMAPTPTLNLSQGQSWNCSSYLTPHLYLNPSPTLNDRGGGGNQILDSNKFTYGKT